MIMVTRSLRSLIIVVAGLLSAIPAIAQASRDDVQLPLAGGRGIAYLGAFLGDITEERARELKLDTVSGAIVGKVVADSPAARAGIREGDVLLSFRNDKIENREHFFRLLNETPPGRLVTLGVIRGREMLRIHVGLGARQGPDAVERDHLFAEANAVTAEAERLQQEADQARFKGDVKKAEELSSLAAAMFAQAEERRTYIEQQLKDGTLPDPAGARLRSQNRQSGRRLLGVGLIPLTDQLASYFGAKSKTGLLVTDVKPGGLVERAGLKAGDCIILVNDEKVASVTELSLAINRARDQVVFTVIRDRTEISLKTSMNTK